MTRPACDAARLDPGVGHALRPQLLGQRLERREGRSSARRSSALEALQGAVERVGALAAHALGQPAAGRGGRTQAARRSPASDSRASSPASTSLEIARESIVGFRLSRSASSDSRIAGRARTTKSTEIRVGVSPASEPAAVVRSRRDSRAMATRRRAAVSTSRGGAATGVKISLR